MFQTEQIIYWTQLKNAVAYRFSMLISLLTGPIHLFASYVIFKAIYEASGQQVIAGFSFEQMVPYMVVAMGTQYLIWDNTHENLADEIRRGNLTPFLLKPVSYWWYQFVRKLGHRTLAFFIEFLPVMFICGLIFGFGIFKTSNIGWYAAAVAIAFVIRYFVQLCLGILGFWFVRAHGLLWIYRMLSYFIQGNTIPLSFYPPAVQKVFFFLPFQFIAYVPARIFLGQYELAGIMFAPWEVILYGALQVLVLFAIVVMLWNISVKKYCGAGT